MRHFILYIVLFFINSNGLLSQYNLPLKFSEGEITWGELTWVKDADESNQGFFYKVPPIEIEDTVYLFSNYRHNVVEDGKVYGPCGYSIKKMNKSTGYMYWEYQKIYRNYTDRKIISNASIDNNQLIVTLYDQAQSVGTNWNFAYPGHIILDVNDGILLDSNFVDKTDTSLPRFRSISDQPSVASTPKPEFFYHTNGYIQRSYTGWTNEGIQQGIIQNILNFKGEKLYSDTFVLSRVNTELFFSNIHDYGVSAFEVTKSSNWWELEVHFTLLNSELKIIKTKNISDYFTDTIQQVALNEYNDGFSLITTAYESPTTKTLRFNFHLIDDDGNLVDKTHYTLYQDRDTGIKYGWIYPIIDKKNKRILITQSRQDSFNESTYYEIFVKSQDSIRRLNKINVENNIDHFRTQYGTVLESGNLLLWISQFDWAKPNSNWFSWILLDGEKMSITSSTDMIALPKNSYKIYPNPTTSLITIEGLTEAATVDIYNMQGSKMGSQRVDENNIIDIDRIPAGMYILDIHTQDRKERHKIIKMN